MGTQKDGTGRIYSVSCWNCYNHHTVMPRDGETPEDAAVRLGIRTKVTANPASVDPRHTYFCSKCYFDIFIGRMETYLEQDEPATYER